MSQMDVPFVVLAAPGAPRFALRAPVVRVGRTADNEMHLDQPELSRQHARFLRDGNEVYLEDLNSSNGTFVNGARLQGRVRLNDLDRIEFASVVMVFHAPEVAPSAYPAAPVPAVPPQPGPMQPAPFAGSGPPAMPPQPGGPMAGSPMGGPPRGGPGVPPAGGPPGATPAAGYPSMGQPPVGQPPMGGAPGGPFPGTAPPGMAPPDRPPGVAITQPGTPPGAAAPPQAALEGAGAAPFLLVKEETTIGRAPGNDLVIGDPQVSSRHAAIRNSGGIFYLLDLGSTNGTYVNGQRVAQPWELNPGDEIGLGTTNLFFRRLAPAQNRRPQAAPQGGPPRGGPPGGGPPGGGAPGGRPGGGPPSGPPQGGPPGRPPGR